MIAPAKSTETTIQPVGSVAEAELLIAHLADVMDALLGIVEDETTLVRNGRLSAAADLERSKTELSRLYVVDTMRIKASKDYLSKALPDVVAALRKRHGEFQALLQLNLTVLATAHAVSESIMRGVSDELARKAMPQGYGASGRAAVPTRGASQPLTVSRSL